MNILLYIANTVHLAAFIYLICDILMKKSVAGISGRTQILLCLVYITRYADVWLRVISVYNTINKLLFISLSLFTVALIYRSYRKTHDTHNDTFSGVKISIPAFVLALFCNGMSISSSSRFDDNWPLEVLWSFSLYLEALAIIPQYSMCKKSEHGRRIVPYVGLLTFYRFLYVQHWIVRCIFENLFDAISFVSGTVQTIILIIMILDVYYSKPNPRHNYWKQLTEVFTAEAVKIGQQSKASEGHKNYVLVV